MATASLNSMILEEIDILVEKHDIDPELLQKFAVFVIENHRKKSSKSTVSKAKSKSVKVKPLTLAQLKQAVYEYFNVSDTTALKRSNSFKMATGAMTDLNLSQRSSWEKIYRKYIGILPEEDGERGESCINGIDIFKYFRPYRVFDLDPQIATKEDIKNAYYRLSKIYHPDNRETGNAKIFDRLTVMYKSITTESK